MFPAANLLLYRCWEGLLLNGFVVVSDVMFERGCLVALVAISERWHDDLNRSNATFPSAEWFELLSLFFVTNWINISNCADRGATIAFIFLSNSLEIILRSSTFDRRFYSPSLADSPEWWASPTSTNCLFGVLASSDMLLLWLVIWYQVEKNSV